MTLKDLWNKLDAIAIIGFLIAIETQISNGSMSFAHTLPGAWIEIVKEWAANLASIGGLLVGVLRLSGGSAQPGSVTSAIVKILIAAFLLSMFLPVGPAVAQMPRPRPAPAMTGNPVKDIKDAIDQKNADFAAANPAGPNDPRVSCDFNIFLGLTPKNLESAIKKCVSDGVGTLVDDTARALDSAQSYKPNPDQDAINCLAPGLAILKAGVIVPAVAEVKDASGNVTTPAVPAKAPGLILLFQKYREFVLAGGLTSCKTWVDTAVNATATQAVNNVAGLAGAALLLPK